MFFRKSLASKTPARECLIKSLLVAPACLVSASVLADPPDTARPQGTSSYVSVGAAVDEDNGAQAVVAGKIETGAFNVKGSLQVGATKDDAGKATPEVTQAAASVQWTKFGQEQGGGCKLGESPCFTPKLEARFERNLALNRPWGVYAGGGLLLRANEFLGDTLAFRARLEAGGEIGASVIEDKNAKPGDKWKSGGTTAGFTGPLAALGAVSAVVEGGIGVCYLLDDAARNKLCADLQLMLRPGITHLDSGVGLRLGYEHVLADDVTKGPVLFVASESRLQGSTTTDFGQGGRGGRTDGEAHTGLSVGIAY